jgi:hypothetical protein
VMQNAQCVGAQTVRDISNQITSLFATGTEYAQRSRNNSQYLEDLYDAILRRGPDASGFTFWLTQLNSVTRESVRIAFVNSSEFQGRVQAVINQGCVH